MMNRFTRRAFVRSGSLALLALGLPPQFLTRALLAQPGPRARKTTLICIFQRGAVDGLNMVVPFGEKAYYVRRRVTAIPAPTRAGGGALDLDGFFGMHPALAIADLERFGVGGGRDASVQQSFERVYGTASGDLVSGAADDAFEAVRILNAVNPLQYRPAAGVTYPNGNFGRSLRQIAQLLKSG